MKVTKNVWRGTTAGSPNRFVNARVTIAAGKRKVLKVKVTPEGRIHRVAIKQTSGTNIAFTARLVETILPYGTETSNDAYNASLGANPEIFDIIAGTAGAAQSATAGAMIDFKDSVGVPFITQDSDYQALRERFLYLVIIPANASDETTWEVTVVSSSEVF